MLYSISKLLNEIGSSFVEDGIGWISGIIDRTPDLASRELEVNTVYYLENLMRSYLLQNRYKSSYDASNSTSGTHRSELSLGEGVRDGLPAEGRYSLLTQIILAHNRSNHHREESPVLKNLLAS